MGSVGLIFTPVLVRHLLGPPGFSASMTSSDFLLQQPLLEGIIHHQLPTHHHHPPYPLSPTHPLYVQSVI